MRRPRYVTSYGSPFVMFWHRSFIAHPQVPLALPFLCPPLPSLCFHVHPVLIPRVIYTKHRYVNSLPSLPFVPRSHARGAEVVATGDGGGVADGGEDSMWQLPKHEHDRTSGLPSAKIWVSSRAANHKPSCPTNSSNPTVLIPSML